MYIHTIKRPAKPPPKTALLRLPVLAQVSSPQPPEAGLGFPY